MDLVLAGQSFDVGVPPSTCLLEDKFVCIACLEMSPTDLVLLPKIFLSGNMWWSNISISRRPLKMKMLFEKKALYATVGPLLGPTLMLASLVCGTPMLATVPARIAYDFAERWPIKILPFPFKHDSIRVFAYWHSSRNQDVILSAFVSAAKSAAALSFQV